MQLHDILAPYSKGISPGCALAITKEGNLLSDTVAGYADTERNARVSRDTNFRLASVTKQFMALAILLLSDEKLVNLEDKLPLFFPDFPAYGQDITIHQLLTHSSGLADYEGLIAADQSAQVHDEDVLELLKLQTNTLFSPGEKYSYSNGGYCLLRLIVERVAGQEIGQFLRDRIFLPLGMHGTTVNHEGLTHIPNRAYGYSFDTDKNPIRTDQDKTSATIGDGGIYSSIADMQKWPQAIFTDILLSRQSRELMLTRHILTDEGPDVYYGYGLCLKDHDGKRIAYHGGSSIGFETGTYYELDARRAVIFLSNRTGERGSDIAQEIADIA